MLIFAVRNGALAEWLGAGLQNLSQWFDSATHLTNAPGASPEAFFSYPPQYVVMPDPDAPSCPTPIGHLFTDEIKATKEY